MDLNSFTFKQLVRLSSKISSISENLFYDFPILQKFKRPDVNSKGSSKAIAQNVLRNQSNVDEPALQGFFEGKTTNLNV